MPIYTPPVESFERSSCTCDQCRAGCKSMPGFLIPKDVSAIMAHLGIDEDNGEEAAHFLTSNFAASEGPTVGVVTPTGVQVYKIPTIVPQQRPDGRCVFLDSKERCSIHQVSPFGCRAFSVCDPPSEEAQEKSAAGIRACMEPVYQNLGRFLMSQGSVSPPLAVRRGRLVQLLNDIHASAPPDEAGSQAVRHPEPGNGVDLPGDPG